MSLEFVGEYKDLIAVTIPTFGGLFAFVQWFDSRKRELQERRYKTYMELVGIISGKRPDSSTPNFTEQIAAAWFLLEYKEYKETTKRIFSGSIEDMSNPEWVKHVLPHIREMLDAQHSLQ